MESVVLRTARLVLDQPRPSDVDDITRACGDPLFERYLTTPWPYRREHALGFVEEFVPSGWAVDREYTWALRTSADGPLLGVVCLRRAHGGFGFWMDAAHRGHGYMAEAVRAVADWGLDDLRMPEVTWEALVGNLASAATARKGGLAFSGTRTGRIPMRDGSTAVCWHAVLTRSTDAATALASWPAETRA
ncbi:GNAT family N-acetyltransferase [Agromyces sp. MMS24-JH15]|uniref:GNAT family N-acetyltransferase n=1 Tax=Agromyces sp. MMS24-JH15 TaxID=3243765 RepID=UPI0037486847